MSKIQKLIESGQISKSTKTTDTSNQLELVKSKKYDFEPVKPLLKWVGGKTQILETDNLDHCGQAGII